MPTDQFTYGLPIRELLLVGLVAAVVTLLLTGPVRMLALKVGAVAWPRGRDVHVTPTPRWGGLAMFGGVLAGLLLSLQLPALRLAYFEQSTEVVGVVVATGLLVGVGMLDDRYDLDALTKFAAQVTAAGLLVLYGVQWLQIWIPIGGDSFLSGSVLALGQSQSVLLTVLVTVVLVNAMNFVDGLDGLAAGIGLITTLATAVFCIGLISENGNDPATFVPALLAVVLAGSCLGFLPHNFHPARIFMGDTGSMMVGVMLAAAITSASGRVPQSDTPSAGDLLALVSPVVVLVGIVFIPSLDLLMAVVRRTRAGTSPFSPDKMHLHHRLLQVGHSHRRAVLLVYLWVAVIAFGAVALALVPRTGLVLAATGIALVVAFVASAVPHRSRMRTAASAAPVAAGETAIASTDDLPDAGPGRRAPPARPSAGGPVEDGPGPPGPAAAAPVPGRVVPGGDTSGREPSRRDTSGRDAPGGPAPWTRGAHRPSGGRGPSRTGTRRAPAGTGGPLVAGTAGPAPAGPGPTRLAGTPTGGPEHVGPTTSADAGPPTPPTPPRPVAARPRMPRGTAAGPPTPAPTDPGPVPPRPQHPRGTGHRAHPAATPGPDQPTVPTPAHHPARDRDA
ncbi:MraY family glycosyltransferase [Pseudonocardia alni]|uniref:UDP-N-acetylmuramyl pentapeptide phosphotransferase/UDP-N-acetylglucosamine-1-phosphate transferase n=2 Tax=Pseudonocardia TaxID=1847 RepID=A0AA44ZP90_PSEA5|nr:MraY family glycosyltransferase [Pseudonocardia alni]PKB30623.1 UDP-N-acetylmuramyl pentapeptide phosphotransferase/UDP-N-acetylglucosamine-1-phosphate transferase [Pseudonocardia alni]